MRPYLVLFSLALFALGSCVKDRISTATSGPVVLGDRKLIHYWSFNSAADSSMLHRPDTTIGGGTLNCKFATGGYMDVVTPGSTLNLRRGEDSGSGFRVRNQYLYWTLFIPTTGYKQPVLQFAVQKSNSGPSTNSITYTTDGVNYVADGLSATSITISTSFTQYSFDFSTISGANNNPKFAVRFSNADTSGGNNRYDNISVDAFAQ